MNCTPRHPCCKITLDLYKQLQLALTIASEEKREKSNCVLSIMELLKKVLLQEDNDTSSNCSVNTICSEFSDSDSESLKVSNYQDDTDIPSSTFVLGLSAPVVHLTDPLHTVVTTNIPAPPTILGLSAAGLNAPVAPGPVNDLKLIMERTTSALRCLRQHILPDIHLKTEC